jgi:hypothetical protein
MDSVLSLLKQEINTTMDAEHDLAKWKLGVTAALGAAAFGLAKENSPNYWLFLLIPFVCAYVDLYSYQYDLRIRVIALFLRENPDKDDALLNKYEELCEKLRGPHHYVFSLEEWAGFGCSLGASACGPLIYYAQHSPGPGLLHLLKSHWAAGGIVAFGMVLIALCYGFYRYELLEVNRASSSQTAPAST